MPPAQREQALRFVLKLFIPAPILLGKGKGKGKGKIAHRKAQSWWIIFARVLWFGGKVMSYTSGKSGFASWSIDPDGPMTPFHVQFLEPGMHVPTKRWKLPAHDHFWTSNWSQETRQCPTIQRGAEVLKREPIPYSTDHHGAIVN